MGGSGRRSTTMQVDCLVPQVWNRKFRVKGVIPVDAFGSTCRCTDNERRAQATVKMGRQHTHKQENTALPTVLLPSPLPPLPRQDRTQT